MINVGRYNNPSPVVYNPGVQERNAQDELVAALSAYPEQDENGIDLTLVRYYLTLTPAERIQRNYHARTFAARLREAAREAGLRGDGERTTR
jgi:hypothetical protein